ncbi:YeiH family protein [Sporosalibacterium faouarense]|uniref:YeiH family protein n=1 Tax=Sporosalibacterium faouarense TaxID=516123 RepID=UPI00141CB8F0|nr:putative sulfate exporter family transporter [Sporosalibacterium faouarense]MTI49632.1 putative sulfate exporter family transporter [Bacillota bacterium]
MIKKLPGLALVLLVTIISILINTYVFSFLGTLTIGIILGIFYSNTIGIDEKYQPGVTFSLKKILKWGIVLLGVELNFNLVLSLGPWIIALVIFLMTLSLIVSRLLGKWFNINPKLATLLGVGSSICGTSAIVAMGPVIDADEDDVAISVAIISFLGAIGVLVYTFFSYILPLTDVQYGIWAGGTLQGVAHALAAAGARGTDSLSLDIGTIVKMSRVALLAPVAVVLSFAFKDNSADSNKKKKVKFPMYVLLFILTGVIFTLNSSLNIFPTAFTLLGKDVNIVSIIKEISSFFILMAMVSMGLKVNFKSFKTKGLKALYACSLLFLLLSVTGYFLSKLIA